MASEGLATDIALRIDPICAAFEAAWKDGGQPSLDAFVEQAAADDRGPLRAELARIERLYRHEWHASTDSDSASSTVSSAISDRAAASAADPYKTAPTPPGNASRAVDEMPATFGQYEVVSVLGEGGFGVVYRGRDPDLNRDVAIKVPHRERLSSSDDIQLFLAEARLLASLKHPGIVPVYYFGRSSDGLCYVVSQFMPGGDLATLIKRKRPSHLEAVELLTHIAEALSHAHQHGLVHRDIKPGNILIDESGHPLVADFGLALTDDRYGERPGLVGTPAYMSPEQACGDGHVVDARSDIYSLGVVFYELLTGRRPYRRQETLELLDEIYRGDTRPPRQLDPTIPPELEHICLKAMAKRPADRYTTAVDLAQDLRRWQEADVAQSPPAPRRLVQPDSEVISSTTSHRTRNLTLMLGCGGLLTISITATAAALFAFVSWNQSSDGTGEVATKVVTSHEQEKVSPVIYPAGAPRQLPVTAEQPRPPEVVAERDEDEGERSRPATQLKPTSRPLAPAFVQASEEPSRPDTTLPGGRVRSDYDAETLDLKGKEADADGRYAQAEAFYRQALELRRANLGESHPAVARSLTHLASHYELQGEYAIAEELHWKSLEILRTVLGDHHADVLTGFRNLAFNLASQGKHKGAESLLKTVHSLEQQVAAESPAPRSQFTRIITVRHFGRENGKGPAPLGILGRQSFSPRLRDQVTIYAELPRPAYAYLVAFRPDGVVEVCVPNDDSTPPPRANVLYYPPHNKPDVRYGLSDGIGLYVFAVLASETPLPSFRDFTARHKPEWSPHEAIPGTVWWFDGQTVDALYPQGDDRGKDERAADASKYIVQAAKSLCTDLDHQTSAAIGFGVGP